VAEENESSREGRRQGKVKVLLLENINMDAAEYLKKSGYEVDHFTKAFSEDELLAKLPEYHAVGIRSKTKITAKVIDAASQVSQDLVITNFSSSPSAVSVSVPTKSTSPTLPRTVSLSSTRLSQIPVRSPSL
jgi:hypothetical protein